MGGRGGHARRMLKMVCFDLVKLKIRVGGGDSTEERSLSRCRAVGPVSCSISFLSCSELVCRVKPVSAGDS